MRVLRDTTYIFGWLMRIAQFASFGIALARVATDQIRWGTGLIQIAMAVLLATPGSAYYHYVHYTSRNAPFTAQQEKFNLGQLPNNTLTFFVSDQGPAANEAGATTLGLAGFNGGKLKETTQRCIVVRSDSMQRVEDVHMILLHAIFCAVLEKAKVSGVGR